MNKRDLLIGVGAFISSTLLFFMLYLLWTDGNFEYDFSAKTVGHIMATMGWGYIAYNLACKFRKTL